MELNQGSGTMNWDEYMRWQDTFLMKHTAELSKNPELVNQILQTYVEKTREQVHNIFRSPPHANIMAKKLAVIINFFHQSRGNDKKIDMGEFLDSMSEAIAMYCDLRISALMMYKERIEDVQHAISTVLKMYLGNNHTHIVNALLRVKRHKFSKNLFEKLFTYIEEKAPFKDCKSSPITYCRYLLFYRQWKKMYSDVAILKQLSTRGQANLKPPPNFRNHPLFDVLRPQGISVPPNMTLFFLTAPMNTNTAVEKFFQYLKSQNALDQDRCEKQITPMEDVIEVIDLTDDPQIKRESNKDNVQPSTAADNSVNEVTLALKRMTPVSSQSTDVPKRNICSQPQSQQSPRMETNNQSLSEYLENSCSESISHTSNIFRPSQCSTSSMQFLEELSQTSKLPPWSTERSSQDTKSNIRINETESTDTGIFSDRSVSDGCGNSPGYELEVKDFCTVSDITSTIVIDDEDDTPQTESAKNPVPERSNQFVSPKPQPQSPAVSNVNLSKSAVSDECTIVETFDVVSIVIPEDTDTEDIVQNEILKISDNTTGNNSPQKQLCQNVTKVKPVTSTSNSAKIFEAVSENSESNSVVNNKKITSSDSAVLPTEKSGDNRTTLPTETNSSSVESALETSDALIKNKTTENSKTSQIESPLASNIIEESIIDEVAELNEEIGNTSPSKDTVVLTTQKSTEILVDNNNTSPKKSVMPQGLQSSESNQISNETVNENIGGKKSRISVQSIAIGTDELPLFTDINRDETLRTSQEVKHLREMNSSHQSIDEEEDEINQMYVGPLKIRPSITSNKELELLTSPHKEPDFHGFSNNRSSEQHGSDHTASNSNINCSVHLQNITEKAKESLKCKSQNRKVFNISDLDNSNSYESPKDVHIKINVPKTILKTSNNKIRKSSKNKKSVVVTNEKLTRFIQNDDEEEIEIEYDETVETKSGRKFAANSTILSQSRKGGSNIIMESHYDKPDSEEESELEKNEDYEEIQERRTQQRSNSRDGDPYSRYSYYNNEDRDLYTSPKRKTNPSPRRSRSRRSSVSSETNSRYETRSRSRSRSIEPTKFEITVTPRKSSVSRRGRSNDRKLSIEEMKRKYSYILTKEIRVDLIREDLVKKKLEIDDQIRVTKQQERLRQQQEQRRERYYKRKKESLSNTDEFTDETQSNSSPKRSRRSAYKERRGRPPRKKEETLASPPADKTYYYSAPLRCELPLISSPALPIVPTLQNSIERLHNQLATKILQPEQKLNFDKKFRSIKSGNVTGISEDNTVSSDLSINSDSNASDTLKCVQDSKDFNEAVPLHHVSNSKSESASANRNLENISPHLFSLNDETTEHNISADIPMTNIPDSTVDDSSLNIATSQDTDVDNKRTTKSSSKPPITSRPVRKCQSERKSGFFSKETIRSHRIQFSNYYRNKARADFFHVTGDSQLPTSSHTSSSSSSPCSVKDSSEISQTKDSTSKISWEAYMTLPENKQTEELELLNPSDVLDEECKITRNVSGSPLIEQFDVLSSKKNLQDEQFDPQKSISIKDQTENSNFLAGNSTIKTSIVNKDFKGVQILKNELFIKINKEKEDLSKDKSANQEQISQKNSDSNSKQGTTSSIKTSKSLTSTNNTDETVHLKKEVKNLHSRPIKVRRTPSTSVDQHASNNDKIVKKKKYHPLPSTKKKLKFENNFFSITESTNNNELSKRRLEFIDNKSSLNNPDSSIHRKKSLNESPTPTTSQVLIFPKSKYIYEIDDDISLAIIKQQLAETISGAHSGPYYCKDGKIFNSENEIIGYCDISVVSYEEVIGEGTVIGTKTGTSFLSLLGKNVIINKMKDKGFDSNKSVTSPTKNILFGSKTMEKQAESVSVFKQVENS